MNRTSNLPPPDDATLVAWLDGELDAHAAVAVERAVQRDARLAHRVRLLSAARAELGWALSRPADAPPSPPQRPVRGITPRALAVLLAVAAIAVVVVLAATRTAPRAVAAENGWLRVEVVPLPEQQLFAGIRFELRGTARTGTPVRAVARERGEDDEQLARRVLADGLANGPLPIVIDATVTGPDGIARTGPVVDTAGTWTGAGERVAVELVDVQLQHPSIPPVLTVALEPHGPREDFVWAFRRVGPVQPDAVAGFVPEQPGRYAVRFALRSFMPPGDGRSPAFPEPLLLDTTVIVRGAVGAWSEPVDGMRARIAASSDHPTADRPLVVALQLRNDGDRARSFNVTGTTLAKIPQPFHFDLTIDGVPCRQRERLGVVTVARSEGLALPVGTARSVIALADYWRLDGEPPSRLAGRRLVGLRFHFEASVFQDGDRELWQGRIDAPPVPIEIPAR